MPKPKREEEVKEGFVFPTYSKEELYELKKELDAKYQVTRTLSKGEICTFIDTIQYIKDNGGLSSKGAVIISNWFYDKDGHLRCDNPTRYAFLQNKIEQLNRLLRKKEYAQAKELEALAATVDGMHIDINEVDYQNVN